MSSDIRLQSFHLLINKFIILLICTNSNIIFILGHGQNTFQCPNGYFLSQFSSAYDGSERFYKFGCAKFSTNIMGMEEICTTTETASTENGDMYLSCGSDQYTVGVEIIEDVAPGRGVDSWQLLCCHSESIKIRIDDCIDTKFLNDYRRSSTFSSSAQIFRRWQAMPENGDKRWWLQLCPVDLIYKKPKVVTDIRAKRQLPWEWTRGRFPVINQNYNNNPLNLPQTIDNPQKRLFEVNNRVQQALPISNSNAFVGSHFVGSLPTLTTPNYEEQETPGVDLPKLSPAILIPYRSRIQQFNEKIRARTHYTLEPTLISSTTTVTTTEAETTTISPTPAISLIDQQKPIEAIDYYEMYDENFDKKKHTEGGLLRGFSDILQNIQDGLTLAQAAFPANKNKFNFRIDITPPPPIIKTTTSPYNVMYSNDEDSSLHIGPFTQTDKKYGPRLRTPLSTEKSSIPPKRELNTIEGMLQMIGLCQGHDI